jgi:tripartite ATP-independent transporter DctM subunit
MIIAFLFIAFLVLLFLGLPVAFALGIPTVFYFFLQDSFVPIEFMAHSMTTPLFNYVLVALPAFLLSGRMMNSSGVTDRLFDAAIAVVGRFRGGLAHANVFASMLFASMSGTAVGDAGGLGQVEMQMMEKAKYRKDFAAGITAASSILGPIIPPSVSMVILGATAEISIGRLFMAGIIPGIIMALALMGNITLRAHFTKEGKTWPVEKVPLKKGLKSCARAILPMFCPVIIIGSISMGIVTPTEAAVLAIDYALLLGLFYREISWKSLWKTLEDTVVTTGVFMYIIAIAGFFTWVVTREGLPIAIRDMLAPLMSVNPTVGLLLIAAFLLVVGCFLDTTAAILLVAPVIMPIVRSLGVDVVHFGVIMIVALLIGIITPPFGICLFVLSDVAELPVWSVTKEAIRYLPAMIICLLIVIFFPQIVLYIPNLIFK